MLGAVIRTHALAARLTVLGLLVLGLTVLGPGLLGRASAQDRARVVLPLPADLEERLEGQTSDLDWSLEPRRMPTPRDLDDAARRAADSRVVLWVEPLPTGLRLHFVDVRDRRLLVRDFEAPSDEAFGGSATLEAVAVAVRSALQALSLGVAAPPAAPPAAPTVAPPPTPTVEPPPPSAPSPWRFEAEPGWWLAFDGESPVQQGPTLQVRLRRSRLVLGLGGQVGLGARLQDPLTRVSVSRHAATLDLGVALVEGPRGGLDLLARGGLARFRRGEVEARVEGLVPTPAQTTSSALAGLHLAATFAPTPNLAFRLAVGANVLPAAPLLRYADEAGNTENRNSFNTIQPSASLTLVVRARPPAPTAPEESTLAHFSVTRFSDGAPPWERWE